jgi:hypothetical protein
VVIVRDRRITHFRAYYEPAEALAAVGLADEPQRHRDVERGSARPGRS